MKSDPAAANRAILAALGLNVDELRIRRVQITLEPFCLPTVEVEISLHEVTEEGELATELHRYELVERSE